MRSSDLDWQEIAEQQRAWAYEERRLRILAGQRLDHLHATLEAEPEFIDLVRDLHPTGHLCGPAELLEWFTDYVRRQP